MQKVRVNKMELMAIIQDNREKHQDAYEQAFEGYRKTAIEVLEENLAQFKAGTRKSIRWTEMPPENHSDDYDRVLQMLEMSVEEEVELEAHEFSQYVQDDWGWKRNWEVSNTKYMT